VSFYDRFTRDKRLSVNQMFNGDDERHVRVLKTVFSSFSRKEKILLCTDSSLRLAGQGPITLDALFQMEMHACSSFQCHTLDEAFSKLLVTKCPADLLGIGLEELPSLITEERDYLLGFGDLQKQATIRTLERRYYEKRLEIGI
jgi:hypothetical protein